MTSSLPVTQHEASQPRRLLTDVTELAVSVLRLSSDFAAVKKMQWHFKEAYASCHPSSVGVILWEGVLASNQLNWAENWEKAEIGEKIINV